MSLRANKVGSEIHKALSMAIDKFAREHGGGLLTITNVIMSPDLSVAKVYISVFGNTLTHEKLLKQLEIESFRFKRAITSSLRLRIVPELRYYIDQTLDYVERIDEILKSNPPFHQEHSTKESHEDPESKNT